MNKARVVSAAELFPEVPDSVFLFRSCTGSLEYPGTESAVKEVLRKLGIAVTMDPDQSCCSGYLLTCSGHHPQFSLAVTARNLAIVEKKGLDTFVFCNGCFGYNRELSHILKCNPEYLRAANGAIAKFGCEYRGRTKIHHVQELYLLLLDRIAALVVRPLRGLRVGAHYGCHYLAQKYGILDDPGFPTFHEKIIKALGGEPVFYPERQACCGYSVGRGFTHRESLVQPHLLKKLESAREHGVELITTVCPGCNVALDREQPHLSKMGRGEFAIPAIDLGQLIALAIGVPAGKLGFRANTVSLEKILHMLGLEDK